MTELKELRSRSAEELRMLFDALSKEIYQLRNEFKVTRKIEKPHQIKCKKRTRAQIMTILREEEIRSRQDEDVHGK